MRALLRPGQFTLASIAVLVPTAYESLRQMQVWTGTNPNSLYLAYTNGQRWFLLHRSWPHGRDFLVKEDGSLWVYRDRDFDHRTKTTLHDLAPTGEQGGRCGACWYISLRGENRHSPECSLR